MSIIQPNSIKAIAHSVDIPRLSDEAAKTLAPDVEYRLREVVQEALKFAKHAKRTKLTTEDINNALRLRNVEPVYGFSSKDPAKFLRVAAHPELMYVQDPEVSFNQLIESALPKLPRDAGVTAHWLAINGVQPDLPENISLMPPPHKRRQQLGPSQAAVRAASLQEVTAAAAAAAGLDMQAALPASASADPATAAAAAAGRRLNAASASAAGQQQQQLMLGGGAGGGAGGVGISPRSVANAAVQLNLPLRHAVSRELQVYFDKVVGLILATPVPQPTASSSAAGGAVSAFAAAAAAGGGGGGLPGLGGTTTSTGGAQGAAAATAGAAAAAAAVGGGAGAASSAADKQASLLTGALSSVASDPGLHPLVPYFCAFIADGVKQHLGSLLVLHRLLLLTRALLVNPGLHLGPYLQQLLPAVVTCVVTKNLGQQPTEDHWAVRRQGAALLSSIAAQFAAPHHNLQPRLCRVLAQALLEQDKPLTSKYGAVVGLQALGPQVVRTLLIPHLEPLMSAVLLPAMTAPAQPEDVPGDDAMDVDQQHEQQRRQQQQQQQLALLRRQQQQQEQFEAWQVYGALVSAVGAATYDLLVGHMRGRLPVHLVLPRPNAGQQDGNWQAEYTQTLLAAKRQGSQQHHQQQQQQAGQQQQQQQGAPPDFQQQQQRQSAHPLVGARLKGPPALVRSQAGNRAGGSAAVDGGAGGGTSNASSQAAVAEVLGQSWKEDSDVNATVGALLSLFGEDLLPSLPLPELAATSL